MRTCSYFFNPTRQFVLRRTLDGCVQYWANSRWSQWLGSITRMYVPISIQEAVRFVQPTPAEMLIF